MIPTMPAQCGVCARNFRPIDLDEVASITGLGCDAFPEGIPEDIQTDVFDHRKPHEGDGGLQFVPLPGERHPKA